MTQATEIRRLLMLVESAAAVYSEDIEMPLDHDKLAVELAQIKSDVAELASLLTGRGFLSADLDTHEILRRLIGVARARRGD